MVDVEHDDPFDTPPDVKFAEELTPEVNVVAKDIGEPSTVAMADVEPDDPFDTPPGVKFAEELVAEIALDVIAKAEAKAEPVVIAEVKEAFGKSVGSAFQNELVIELEETFGTPPNPKVDAGGTTTCGDFAGNCR